MIAEAIELPQRSDFDSPWKQALEFYFKPFMDYFFPFISKNIDWDRGYEFLDKELQAMRWDDQIGKRLPDKLVKVWEKNGQETWILLHFEIQGSKDELFENRMFTYYYRTWDRYQIPVVSIAILIDGDPDWRPDCYRKIHYNCSLEMRYMVVKLLDWQTQERRSELEALNNPFTFVVLAQLAVLEANRNFQKHLHAKTALTRKLFETGWSKADILQLHRLIDWLIVLPNDLKITYIETIKQIEEEKQMSYVSTAEWVGIQKGREEGREEGLKEGKHRGEISLFLNLLKGRFGDVPNNYLVCIQQANSKTLLVWAERILHAQTLEEIFK